MSAPQVMVVCDDVASTMRMTLALAKTHYNVTAVPSDNPMATAKRLTAHRPDAIVVRLPGDENVVEIRELLTASPRTRFVLLMRETPPPAAVARIAAEHGAVVLDADVSATVVGATLVTLLMSRERSTAEHG